MFLQTVLVVLLELLKLVVTVLRAGCRIPVLDRASLRASLKFLLPSVIYAVNNNIYLAGLILVPPPIWVGVKILCTKTKNLLPVNPKRINDKIVFLDNIALLQVILCSFRTAVTACLYKFILRRDVSMLQVTFVPSI